MAYDDCTIVYSKTDLNEEFENIIRHHDRFIPKIFNHQQDIIKIHFTYQDKDIFLVADPNIDHANETTTTYKTIKDICQTAEIPFHNQTFSTVISEMKSKIFYTKLKRHVFTKEERSH